MNELDCPIVKDLLPSHLEGLNSPETTAALESHLQGCESCRGVLEALRTHLEAPEPGSQHKVRTLRKIKRKTIKAILITAGILIGLSALFLMTCAIGFPVKSSEIKWRAVTNAPTYDVFCFPGDLFEGSNGEVAATFEFQPGSFSSCGVELSLPGKLALECQTAYTTSQDSTGAESHEIKVSMRKMLNPFHIHGPAAMSIGAASDTNTIVLQFSDKDIVLTFEDGKLLRAEES
ncbi:MAG: zf-HC2 domain-containing protein [Oscillospiraceae bacterium]|jgi:hypothetical protein|nr:zf-HC2 domain-containing protein [Oscillospiraceae bacterium]